MSGWCLPSRKTRIRILGYHDEPRYLNGPFLNIEAIMADAKDKIEKYDIRPGNPQLKTANFSGGNQQKIVLAREMEQDPGVLIVGQPTRGVDVGAIEFIHKRLIAMRDAGKAVLLVSVELDEIRSLSDRILVMFAGRVVGERGPEATRGRAWPADGRRRTQGGRGMSTPFAKLPAWADYGLIPVLNLLVAFLVAGLVVLLVGENPLRCRRHSRGRRIRQRPGHRLHALLRDQLHLHGSRRRRGVSRRPVQYRRRRAGLYSRARRCAGLPRLRQRAALVADLSAGDPGAALVGALWALIPAYLQAKRGSHIVITTIMFNFIAAIGHGLSSGRRAEAAGFHGAADARFPRGGQLPKLDFLLEAFGLSVRSAPLNISFLLALLMAVFVWVLIWRTKLGYEIRTFGLSPKAAGMPAFSKAASSSSP